MEFLPLSYIFLSLFLFPFSLPLPPPRLSHSLFPFVAILRVSYSVAGRFISQTSGLYLFLHLTTREFREDFANAR